MTRPAESPRAAAAALVVAVGATLAWNAAFLLTRGASPWPVFTVAAAPCLAAAAVLYRRDLRALAARPLRDAAVGLLAGLALAAVTYGGHAVLAPASAPVREQVAALYATLRVGSGPFANLPLLVFVIATEEAVFRGLLLDALGRRLRPAAAVGAMALICALSQLASGQPLLVLAAAVLTAAWGALRLGTKGLVAPFVSHLVWDLFVLVLWPLA